MSNPWEQINSKLNILDVVGNYISVQSAGSNYVAVCPFHKDKRPSLHISPQKNLWHCFGCGAGGDMFKFVMDYENVSKKNALEILAKEAGIELKPFSKKNDQLDTENTEVGERKQISQTELGFKYLTWVAGVYHSILLKILQNPQSELSRYCKERKFTPASIKTFGLGYAPNQDFLLNLAKKHNLNLSLLEKIGVLKLKDGIYKDKFVDRLMIPVFDKQGRAVGFTGRILPESSKNSTFERPKYLNSPQTDWFSKSKLWYGWHLHEKSIRKEKKALIVEGNMDVIATHQAGLDFSLASQGTSFTTEQLKQLKYLTQTIWLAFDNDGAGLESSKKFFKQATKIGFEIKKVIIDKQYKDLDEMLSKKPESQIKTSSFLDYILNILKPDLQNSDLETQKSAIFEFLNLLKPTDKLTQEHYLDQLSVLTKKTIFTLSSQMQELPDDFYQADLQDTEEEKQPNQQLISLKQTVLVNFQNFLALKLSKCSFEFEKIEQKDKVEAIFRIFQELFEMERGINSLQEYTIQNRNLLELIASQNTDSDEQKLWQILIHFVDTNANKLFLNSKLQQDYLTVKTGS